MCVVSQDSCWWLVSRWVLGRCCVYSVTGLLLVASSQVSTWQVSVTGGQFPGVGVRRVNV